MTTAAIHAKTRPQLIVVVDTEEEFQWSAPKRRDAISVGHLRQVHRLQAIFDRYQVQPVYVIDYPVAADPAAVAALGAIVGDGRATIGTHLHPWVSPPYTEPVDEHHSFPGNLPRDLEKAKLEMLTERIERAFGTRPSIYKAGRYGIGANSFEVMEELGYGIDMSVSPPFNYAASGGPDFSTWGLATRWLGPRRSVLALPNTGAFIGRLPHHRLHALADSPLLRRIRLPGILSRTGMVSRLRLSPEGHTLGHMRGLTSWLHRRGHQLFVLSLHSPSIAPGHTPFVRDEADRQRLFARLDGYLQYFMEELGGRATTPQMVREAMRLGLLSTRAEPATQAVRGLAAG